MKAFSPREQKTLLVLACALLLFSAGRAYLPLIELAPHRESQQTQGAPGDAGTAPAFQTLPSQSSAGLPASKDSPPGHKAKRPPSKPINLNTATARELMRVPGIGPATAAKIIALREELRGTQGGFRDVSELKRVKGIKEKRLATLAPYLQVSPASASPQYRSLEGKTEQP